MKCQQLQVSMERWLAAGDGISIARDHEISASSSQKQPGQRSSLNGTPAAAKAEQKLEPETYQAIAHWQPQDEHQLELQLGEVVKVLEKYESGWWVAENHAGTRGIIPNTYVTPIVSAAEHSTPKAFRPFDVLIAAYDCVPSTADELAFVVGEKIRLLSSERGWGYGQKVDGTKGYFPLNYVHSAPPSLKRHQPAKSVDVGELDFALARESRLSVFDNMSLDEEDCDAPRASTSRPARHRFSRSEDWGNRLTIDMSSLLPTERPAWDRTEDITQFYPLLNLQSPGPYPEGVNPSRRELYLTDEVNHLILTSSNHCLRQLGIQVFSNLFRYSKSAFKLLPVHKQNELKHRAGLL